YPAPQCCMAWHKVFVLPEAVVRDVRHSAVLCGIPHQHIPLRLSYPHGPGGHRLRVAHRGKAPRQVGQPDVPYGRDWALFALAIRPLANAHEMAAKGTRITAYGVVDPRFNLFLRIRAVELVHEGSLQCRRSSRAAKGSGVLVPGRCLALLTDLTQPYLPTPGRRHQSNRQGIHAALTKVAGQRAGVSSRSMLLATIQWREIVRRRRGGRCCAGSVIVSSYAS